MTALSQIAEIKLMLKQNESEKGVLQLQLASLLDADEPVAITPLPLSKISLVAVESLDVSANPELQLREEQVQIAELAQETRRARVLPDITVGYFNQSFNGPGA